MEHNLKGFLNYIVSLDSTSSSAIFSTFEQLENVKTLIEQRLKTDVKDPRVSVITCSLNFRKVLYNRKDLALHKK